MGKCKCGNNEFYAHQTVHIDVLVDADNTFIRNKEDTAELSIYHADEPFGPYTCTECGETYDTIPKEEVIRYSCKSCNLNWDSTWKDASTTTCMRCGSSNIKRG